MKMRIQKTAKSFAIREQMHIGAALADALPKMMGLKDTAKKLGISETLVRRIECQALFKISRALKAQAKAYTHES